MAKTTQQDPEEQEDARRDIKALFYRKLTETHLFFEVGKIIASELEPSELIQKIIDVLRKTVHFQDAIVYLVRKDMSGLDPFFSTGPLFDAVALGPIYLDNGAPGMIAASGEPLFLEDVSGFDGFLHFPDERVKEGSYIGVALKSDSRVVGAMGFSRPETGAFRVEEFDLLRTLSPLVSAGLEKAELFKKTLELSRVDELTGLFNYRVLLEKLDEELRRRARSGRDFSFIMIDIDDFKRTNDRYGHLEGSRLLAQMGPLLKASCRAGSLDSCYRYGGEEFSILLPETLLRDALTVAERVRSAVEEYPFTLKATHPFEQITISLGISTMPAGSTKTAVELIHEADTALYRSKAEGKNRVTIYQEGDRMPGQGAPGH
jgi:diguanylate cyclase (GGDEF)-like protein